MNCLCLSKWKKKNTGCEVCCMGFHYIGDKESYNMMLPEKMVNQGLILSLEPPCMLNQS